MEGGRRGREGGGRGGELGGRPACVPSPRCAGVSGLASLLFCFLFQAPSAMAPPVPPWPQIVQPNTVPLLHPRGEPPSAARANARSAPTAAPPPPSPPCRPQHRPAAASVDPLVPPGGRSAPAPLGTPARRRRAAVPSRSCRAGTGRAVVPRGHRAGGRVGWQTALAGARVGRMAGEAAQSASFRPTQPAGHTTGRGAQRSGAVGGRGGAPVRH